MALTKSERRHYNRLNMRLSHIDLNDSKPATQTQMDTFVEELERSRAYAVVPKHHPHKRTNK